MKKGTLLLVLLFISTLVFSQNKRGGDDELEQIISWDKTIKAFPEISRELKNSENNPLVDKINMLELEYLNLKAKEVQYGFANQDLSKLKTKEEVFKAYIGYLKKKIESDRVLITKIYGDTKYYLEVARAKKKDTESKKIKSKVVSKYIGETEKNLGLNKKNETDNKKKQ